MDIEKKMKNTTIQGGHMHTVGSYATCLGSEQTTKACSSFITNTVVLWRAGNSSRDAKKGD